MFAVWMMSIITLCCQSTTPALLTCPEGVQWVERWLQKGHYHVNGPSRKKRTSTRPFHPNSAKIVRFGTIGRFSLH